MYEVMCTRPYLVYGVSVISHFLSNLQREQSNTIKWIFRYLRVTTKKCLCFGVGKVVLTSYTNIHLVGDTNSRKSISAYLTTFTGRPVSWQSKLQNNVALWAEYIALTEACKEILWLRYFFY